jgi:hypothetical protein
MQEVSDVLFFSYTQQREENASITGYLVREKAPDFCKIFLTKENMTPQLQQSEQIAEQKLRNEADKRLL